MRAVIPPAAPLPPVAGGAPHFSAQLGAWVKPLHTAEHPRRWSVPGAAKRRPGNFTLIQRVKWWVACLIWNLTMWGTLAWIWSSFFHGGGQ